LKRRALGLRTAVSGDRPKVTEKLGDNEPFPRDFYPGRRRGKRVIEEGGRETASQADAPFREIREPGESYLREKGQLGTHRGKEGLGGTPIESTGGKGPDDRETAPEGPTPC